MYLPMLRRLCATHRIVMRRGKVENAAVFARAQSPGVFVFNCTGLGARELMQDTAMYPVQGTLVKVAVPKSLPFAGRFYDGVYADDATRTEHSYVIPRTDCYVLGGTVERDNWDTQVMPEKVQRIRDDAELLIPGISQAPVLDQAVGLRPVRPTLALGMRDMDSDIHWCDAYGFGGSGWTLSLGVANACVGFLTATLEKQQHKAKL
jgi:D-amino-acid oxidase